VGPPLVPVTLVVFFDYTCPYSRKLDERLRRLLVTRADSVAILYRHFPLTDQVSRDAALAAVCGDRQGRFIAVHRALLEEGENLEWISPMSVGEEYVPDVSDFRRCMMDSTAMERVADDLRAGSALGVSESPTIVTGGMLVPGALTTKQLDWLVRSGLGGSDNGLPQRPGTKG
jgi:protein-disulfide isomerase